MVLSPYPQTRRAELYKLGALDAGFLYNETEKCPQHIASVQVLELPSGVSEAGFVENLKALLMSRIHLVPYFTNNFDVSLEWYPETGGAYALGLFYKDVDGWISRGRSLETFTAPVGVDGNGNGEFDEDDITDGIPGNGGDYYEIRESVYDIRRKVNTDGGTIKGVEFAFHQPFDAWTDGFWSYFGVNGSVTYVDAEMDAVVPENNLPISLRGTSEWSGNLVAYFERKKFSVRVAANYRDDFLFQEAEDPFRSPEWTEGSTIVDLNMDYKFNKNLRLRFSANNLTGETRRRLWETAGAWKFSDDRDNGQYYTLELRYRM